MTDMKKMFESDNIQENNNNSELDVPDFLKNKNTIMNNNEYALMVQKSTSGLPVKAKPNKLKKVNKQRFKKALVTMCCTCMIIGAIASQGIKSLIKGVENAYEISEAINQFQVEAVSDNTFRVNYGRNHDYHYENIAEHVKTDEDVYLCYRTMGQYTDRVLQYVDGVESIDNFLKTHNYESKEDWIKVSNQQILLKNDITSKQQELDKMVEEYKPNVDIAAKTELGGK